MQMNQLSLLLTVESNSNKLQGKLQLISIFTC